MLAAVGLRVGTGAKTCFVPVACGNVGKAVDVARGVELAVGVPDGVAVGVRVGVSVG